MATYKELKSATVEFTKINGVYISASDPTTSVNPSSTGVIWTNTTTGAQYINTNNAAGENVWKAISSGDGDDIVPALGLPGSNYGYVSGGTHPATVTIDKFPFATDANATDVGDLTLARYEIAGQSSGVSGYTSGGRYNNIIDKFPFATDANASDVGDLTQSKSNLSGHSSDVSGYTSGGAWATVVSVNVIEKFPFATDANATDVGNLSASTDTAAGQSSATYGYTSGGAGESPPSQSSSHINVIQKFPFASDGNASDVGDLTVSRRQAAGQSSYTDGYTSGGTSNVIDKFSFTSDGNASDVGDLSQSRTDSHGGQSSTNYGYTSGGYASSFSARIDKFPYASGGNATYVGDMTLARAMTAGQQY